MGGFWSGATCVTRLRFFSRNLTNQAQDDARAYAMIALANLCESARYLWWGSFREREEVKA
jgi:hypothetical protein